MDMDIEYDTRRITVYSEVITRIANFYFLSPTIKRYGLVYIVLLRGCCPEAATAPLRYPELGGLRLLSHN